MNTSQEAKLTMVKGIVELCEEYASIIAAIAGFQNALTELKAKIAAVDETAQLNAVSLKGITADKAQNRLALCQCAADIAGMIYAFASANSNNTLKEEVNFSVSRLKRKRDGELAPVCQTIYDRAAENLTALKDFGVESENLTGLQQAIADYWMTFSNPRTAVSKRKTRKGNLTQLFRETDGILKERMDKLMSKFRASHPDFYNIYFNLRAVPDPSTTTTQLKGKITDNADGTPIKGAVITVVEINKTAATDSKGEYSIKPIIHGKYTVRIVKEGYEPYENDEIEIKLGDINHLNIKLIGN